MLDDTLIQDSVRNSLPYGRRRTRSNWESFNCVLCHHRGKTKDKKRKAGIIFSDNGFTFRCFRCKAKASWRMGRTFNSDIRTFLEAIGMTSKEIHKLSVHALQLKNNTDVQEYVQKNNSDVVEFDPKSLPVGARSIFELLENNPSNNAVKAAEYLLSRGRYVSTASEYYYLDNPKNQLNERIIIPFKHFGKIVGWTARHFGKPQDDIPKYYANVPNGYLFNNHLLDDKHLKYIVLVEGPFDALSINGCAYMADTPNQKQINWINNSEKIPIIVPDREKSSLPSIMTAIENNWSVAFPEWDENIKDVNEAVLKYGSIWVLKNILDNTVSGNVKIMQQYKLWV